MPFIAPLSQPNLEIAEGTSNETVCYVDTSIGVSPVWLHPNGTEVDLVTTTCLDADCFCQDTSGGVSYVLVTNDVHEFPGRALISQHKLTLFICNANRSFQGKYNCSVKSQESGFENVSTTFTLLITSAVSMDSDEDLFILIGISMVFVLLLLNVAVISAMVGCCFCFRHKRSQEVMINKLSVPGHVNNYYSRQPESHL